MLICLTCGSRADFSPFAQRDGRFACACGSTKTLLAMEGGAFASACEIVDLAKLEMYGGAFGKCPQPSLPGQTLSFCLAAEGEIVLLLPFWEGMLVGAIKVPYRARIEDDGLVSLGAINAFEIGFAAEARKSSAALTAQFDARSGVRYRWSVAAIDWTADFPSGGAGRLLLTIRAMRDSDRGGDEAQNLRAVCAIAVQAEPLRLLVESVESESQ